MSRRLLPFLLSLALAGLAAPAEAAGSPTVLVGVQSGDAALGQALSVVGAPIAFIDARVDQSPSTDEPLYWDLDDSHTVSVGDIRLRDFLGLAAGTEVLVSDLDAGRTLLAASAWFGATGGTWFADLDASRSVTAGDLRLGETASVVADGSAEAGQPLAYPQGAQGQGTAALADLDGDRRRDAGEGLYLNLDTGVGPPVVSLGDLRVVPVARAAGSQAPVGGSGGGGDGDRPDASGAETEASTWGTPETVLLVLGLANLVGLAFVYTRLRDGGAPRNPFK